MSAKKELITAQALAKELNLSVETIWRYTREKKIPYIELGNRQYRYLLADVIEALSTSKIQETKGKYTGKNKEKFTYQDYLELPEDPGYHYEVLEGMLVKEPSPNVMHQRVSRRLQRILEDYFQEVDPQGEVFDAPLDVTLSEINVVQPDIFYIPETRKVIIKETRIDGPPLLVVEILSPGSRRRDRLQKMQIYQKSEVQHYWLVNPEERTLECFALRNYHYTLLAAGMDDDIIEHPDFEGLRISLKELWPEKLEE